MYDKRLEQQQASLLYACKIGMRVLIPVINVRKVSSCNYRSGPLTDLESETGTL